VSSAGVRASGPFPDLALADLEGRTHSLAEAWRGGEALFVIGHGDCRTSRQAIPYADRIHRRKTRGVVVLVLQDEAGAARRLAAEQGLSLPVRLEPDPYPLARALDLEAVPALVLVDREGRIDQVSVGLGRADLEAFAARLGVGGTLFAPDDPTPAFRPG
jgi:hypothetical protein